MFHGFTKDLLRQKYESGTFQLPFTLGNNSLMKTKRIQALPSES